ncbi:hypothetical protein [Deinococcus peraridilitoris]|uniref:Tetratricopeptide repeat protein n=1 Tax=Deinococcus peraridilitoris (strain DSM 19664 / LMG 22246 / CIP 109416 / KR-200) TaxID=937777 RepID=L0A487_DEIPD|nr:hypothetical protein [Deinococcus peraridilitoris]AFZ68693.1 hypothetical protein Deipe_3250 [Deinococcus peraridilitoris DSM 19664]
MRLDDLLTRVSAGQYAEARTALSSFSPVPEELPQAARLALELGCPSLSVRWWQEALAAGTGEDLQVRLGHAAALCRLGAGAAAWHALQPAPLTARVAVLRARALSLWSGTQGTDPPGDVLEASGQARDLARQEGDAAALVAAVTLIAETLLARGEARAALHALAEGLKVTEVAGQAADAHLLAVLAHVQMRVGSPRKAQATAEKALQRSRPASPARVQALRALGRLEEAATEASAGELTGT